MGYNETLDRFETKGKGIFTAKLQNVMCLCDSLKICKFMLLGGVNLTTLCTWLDAVTGENNTIETLLKKGEAIFNLKRIYNNRMGITKKDDDISKRVLTEAFTAGGAKNKLPSLEVMIEEYYSYRKWDADGAPCSTKIKELELTEY